MLPARVKATIRCSIPATRQSCAPGAPTNARQMMGPSGLAAMDMDILPGVPAEDVDGLGLIVCILGTNPQKQPTVLEVFLDIARMVLANQPGQNCADQSARACGNRSTAYGRYQRTA